MYPSLAVSAETRGQRSCFTYSLFFIINTFFLGTLFLLYPTAQAMDGGSMYSELMGVGNLPSAVGKQHGTEHSDPADAGEEEEPALQPFQKAPQKTYTIRTYIKRGTGTISPSGAVKVSSGKSRRFTITPGEHYHVADVLVDGTSVGPRRSYTFKNVNANHTIFVNFAIDSFTITASAGINGTIEPPGPVEVNYGSRKTFTVKPDPGYHIADVWVDHKSVGKRKRYTFNNVTTKHTISAIFAIDTFAITPSAGSHGRIDPSQKVTIEYDEDQTFTFTPDPGYFVSEVSVDGASVRDKLVDVGQVGGVKSYIFENVRSNHTIAATFTGTGATLAWDPGTPEYNISGYNIYYGTATHDYLLPPIDAKNVTSYPLTGLIEGQTYYFALTAYDCGGHESSLSEEISFTMLNGKPIQKEKASRKEEMRSPGSRAEPQPQTRLGAISKKPLLSPYNNTTDNKQNDHPPILDGPGKGNDANEKVTLAPLHGFIVGMGSYPKGGGWVEVVDKDVSYQVPIKTGVLEYNGYGDTAPIAVGDIDGDGKEELLIAFGPASIHSGLPASPFQVLDDHFAPLAWARINWSDFFRADGEPRLIHESQKEESKAEIVIGFGPGKNGKTELFDYTPEGLKHRTWTELNRKPPQPLNTDLHPAGDYGNGHRKHEVILGLSFTPMKSTHGCGFEVLNDYFVHLAWGNVGWEYGKTIDRERRPACNDVNGYGKDYIRLGLGSNSPGRIEICDFDSLRSSGEIPPDRQKVQRQEYENAFTETRSACGDIDSESEAEVILGLSSDGRVHVLLFDDVSYAYRFYGTLQTCPKGYNGAND